ncbi:hypothetical protein [Nocardioides baekrokdamisoli]|nr:hypothetical protein [Nocardioides baekrokdamisoli]
MEPATAPRRAVVVLVAAVALAATAVSADALSTPRTTPKGWVGINPCRVADTRTAGGVFSGIKMFSMSDGTGQGGASGCGVPTGASAVTVNVTVTGTTGGGYVAAYPGGTPWPGNSTVNFSGAGVTVANGATVLMGSGAKVAIKASTATNVLIDVTGYYVDAPAPKVSEQVNAVDIPRGNAGVIATTTTTAPGSYVVTASVQGSSTAAALNCTLFDQFGSTQYGAFGVPAAALSVPGSGTMVTVVTVATTATWQVSCTDTGTATQQNPSDHVSGTVIAQQVTTQ